MPPSLNVRFVSPGIVGFQYDKRYPRRLAVRCTEACNCSSLDLYQKIINSVHRLNENPFLFVPRYLIILSGVVGAKSDIAVSRPNAERLKKFLNLEAYL